MWSDLITRALPRDECIVHLSERLADFYKDNQEYYRSAEGGKDSIYQPLCDVIQVMSKAKDLVSVLELGAGRTRFPRYATEHGLVHTVSFTAHDIDDTNVAYYESQSISHIVGPVVDLLQYRKFDVVFSTYVLEHVPDPRGFLDASVHLLAPRGIMVIVCPKYVWPLYVPPALRWLPRWQQLCVNLFLTGQSLLVRITGRPNFWICLDPALFHRPWRRDYDAN